MKNAIIIIFLCKLILKTYFMEMGIGDWGLGIGDWGLGPNPQSPMNNIYLN